MIYIYILFFFPLKDFTSLCEIQASRRLDETHFRGGGQVPFYTGKKVQDMREEEGFSSHPRTFTAPTNVRPL